LPNSSTCPTDTLYWFCDNAYSRISDICNVPCVQTTWNTSGNDWTIPWPIRYSGTVGQHRHALALDDALTFIALPVKLGGLGILYFKTCTPLPFAAAPEALDTLFEPLLDQDVNTANQTILSQQERCQEAFRATRESLLESLDPQNAKSLLEASSLLGTK
jgi:hypothetical protein